MTVPDVPVQGVCDSEQRNGGARRLTRQICRSAFDLRAPNAHTERHRLSAARRARSAPRASLVFV
jgi:hypothetical protein